MGVTTGEMQRIGLSGGLWWPTSVLETVLNDDYDDVRSSRATVKIQQKLLDELRH